MAASHRLSYKCIGTYSDPACLPPEPADPDFQGLLLSKQGPTANPAIAGAYIKGLPKNTVLTELGYDIRKPVNQFTPYGSHCSATSPRFKITLANGRTFTLACKTANAPQFFNGWIRLRWTGNQFFSDRSPVMSLSIVFDDGTYGTADPAALPDFFGLAILDNIDVNGVLVGRGPASGEEDEGSEKDK